METTTTPGIRPGGQLAEGPRSHVPVRHDPDGWRARRGEVIARAGGLCARCGLAGADTAFREGKGEDLLAAHTRCVVGLGPPPAGPDAPVNRPA